MCVFEKLWNLIIYFPLSSFGRWSVMNMGLMQQASMRETAIYNWRGLMSTSMRHMVPEMLNCSLNTSQLHYILLTILWVKSLFFHVLWGGGWSLSQLHMCQLISGPYCMWAFGGLVSCSRALWQCTEGILEPPTFTTTPLNWGLDQELSDDNVPTCVYYILLQRMKDIFSFLPFLSFCRFTDPPLDQYIVK